jgi:hypothetical protein
MEDRPLKSAGLHFYVLKPTKTNKYFILRASFDLNGDYGSRKFGKTEFLKFSITPLIGWKKSENLSYAVGLSYGYTFGRPLVIPVISFNKNFSCRSRNACHSPSVCDIQQSQNYLCRLNFQASYRLMTALSWAI